MSQMKLLATLKQMKHPFSMFTHRDVKTDLKALKPHYDHLPPDLYLQKRLNLPLDKVMRCRRTINYNIEFDKSGNMTTFHEDYKLEKYIENQGLQYASLYEEITPEMKADQNYKDFLYNTLSLLWQLKQFNKASVSVHAVRTVSDNFILVIIC